MPDKTTRTGYINHFTGEGNASERQREALKQALDIRKFETDLYWKRASYFWTFIAGMFAGYFLLTKDPQHSFESAYVVACLGLTFSVAWYFVNRGSKAWQRNWEIQVDLLEDEIMGPLYKSAMNRQNFNLFDITAGYPFSPSKINQILGVFVCAVWLFLMGDSLWRANLSSYLPHQLTAAVMTAITIFSIALLLTKGRTQEADEAFPVTHRVRKYHDDSTP
ncbi:MAG: hypothetical protein SGI88_11775 [Candidatus Hydrogenedentes bacterium]|nr:hypothetical protein [Candidatus Hydrogenedentota bacterium]